MVSLLFNSYSIHFHLYQRYHLCTGRKARPSGHLYLFLLFSPLVSAAQWLHSFLGGGGKRGSRARSQGRNRWQLGASNAKLKLEC